MPMGEKRLERPDDKEGKIRSVPPVLLPVAPPDLPSFSAATDMINVPALLPPADENSPRRWFGLPRSILLEHRLFRGPMTLVREATVGLAQLVDEGKGQDSENQRYILSGSAGCGKSFLLMQAVEHAYKNGWVVIYIPRVESLVDSRYGYQYDLRSQTYLQPSLSRQLVARILALPSNLAVLEGLTTSRPFSIEGNLTGRKDWLRGAPLVEVLRTGAALASVDTSAPHLSKNVPGATTAATPESSASTLDFLISELATQSRVPVLVAVDGVQALYHTTMYRDPHFQRIQPWHLQIPRTLLELLGGKKVLTNGTVLGALSYTNPQFTVPSILTDALDLAPTAGYTPLLPYPYDETPKELYGYIDGIQAFNVPESLELEEASRLFEVWMKRKVGSTRELEDSYFLAKYHEASGNPRNFVWKGMLSSLEGDTPPPDSLSPLPQLKLTAM